MQKVDRMHLRNNIEEAEKILDSFQVLVDKYNNLSIIEEDEVKSGNYKYTAERIESFVSEFKQSKNVLYKGLGML
jgi:hypothetical protein